MRYEPERRLERLAAILLPPESREHILGDLAECAEKRADYLRNLASALPCVIVCQIRRRVNQGGVIFNALVSGVALFMAPKPPAFEAPSDWIRLVAPWAVWMAGSVLAAAYGPAGQPTRSNYKVLLATVVAAVLAGGLVGAPRTSSWQRCESRLTISSSGIDSSARHSP